jgi:hypothetical protein
VDVSLLSLTSHNFISSSLRWNFYVARWFFIAFILFFWPRPMIQVSANCGQLRPTIPFHVSRTGGHERQSRAHERLFSGPSSSGPQERH